MRHLSAFLIFFFLCVPASGEDPIRRVRLIPPFPLAGYRLADLNGDGATEILLVGSAGEVRTWKSLGPGVSEPLGELRLADPGHTILALEEASDFDVAQSCREVTEAPPSDSRETPRDVVLNDAASEEEACKAPQRRGCV